jgi:hypothetical protein
MYNENDGPFLIRHVVQSLSYIKYGMGAGLHTIFNKEPKNFLDISVGRAVENKRKGHNVVWAQVQTPQCGTLTFPTLW